MNKSSKFSPEVRERAVRMVQEHRDEYPSLWSAVESLAPKIGCVPHTLYEWVRKHEVDSGISGDNSRMPVPSTARRREAATNSRCREKFGEAVHKLAVGEGDVRDRLRRAYRALRTLCAAEIPPSSLDDWQWVMGQLTRYGPDAEGGRTAIDHTMGRIRNATGRLIAERILLINGRFQDRC